MAREPGDHIRPAQQQARLRTAEQLVTTGGDQVGTGPQPGVGVGLVGEHRAAPQQPGPDIADHWHAKAGQFPDANRGREAFDEVVGRVHLQDERSVRADRPLIVREHGPVGRAHLTDPGSGGLQQVRQPESVADLDQLATADDDLAPGGQRRGSQGQRGGVVVDHVHRTGRWHRPGKSRKRARATSAALARHQVELHVCAARRGLYRVPRGGRQRRAAKVGVHQNAGRVDHRGEGGGDRRQRVRRGVGDGLRADIPGPGQFLRAGDGRLDQGSAEPFPRRDQPRVGEHDVRSWHLTARIHGRTLAVAGDHAQAESRTWADGGGETGWRRL